MLNFVLMRSAFCRGVHKVFTSGVCEPAKNENSNNWDLLLTREKLKLYKQNYNGTKW